VAYTKTTWVSGNAPGISAENLNKIETGIDDTDQALTDHEADATNPHLVTGQFTFGVPNKGWVHEGRGRYKLLQPIVIIDAVLCVNTAPTGADGIMDLNKDGTTLFTTQGNRPTVSAGNQDGTAATPDVTACAAGTVLTADIDQVGSTLPGSDWTLVVRYRETD